MNRRERTTSHLDEFDQALVAAGRLDIAPASEAPATMELALDTLYSLLADGDFRNLQDEIGAALTSAAPG